MTPEGKVKREILVYLKYVRNGYFWMNESVGIFDQKRGCYRKKTGEFNIRGASDILGIWNGMFVAIETKSGKNKPTEHQLTFLENISARGGIAIVAYSVDDVAKFIYDP